MRECTMEAAQQLGNRFAAFAAPKRSDGGDLDAGFTPTPPRPLSCPQNGTVKSNEALVKVLNEAEVPGTDVVGERRQAAAGGGGGPRVIALPAHR